MPTFLKSRRRHQEELKQFVQRGKTLKFDDLFTREILTVAAAGGKRRRREGGSGFQEDDLSPAVLGLKPWERQKSGNVEQLINPAWFFYRHKFGRRFSNRQKKSKPVEYILSDFSNI